MSVTQPTYYAYPQAIDFGSIALGDTQTANCRIEFRLAPGNSAGGTLTSQTNISNEVFLVDDQGSNADDVIRISGDGGVTYNDRLSLSSFPATEPPNFINITIACAPVQNMLPNNAEFVIYLRAVQNKQFIVPIHFRIAAGSYVTPSQVREEMGPLGTATNTVFTQHDSFSDPTFPLWTNKSGTWKQATDVGGSVHFSGTSGVGVDAINITNFPDTGAYDCQVTVSMQSGGTAGLVFAYQDSSNYYRATIVGGGQGGLGKIDQVIGGITTILSQTSVATQSLNTPFNLRVEKNTLTASYFLNDTLILRATGLKLTGPSGLIVTQTSVSTAWFNEYHVDQQEFQFADTSIQKWIEEEQSLLQQRMQRYWAPQTITEVIDWMDRQPTRMPFVVSRFFNTLPSGIASPSSSDGDNRTFEVQEHSFYLKYRPVMTVIAVEENTSTDGANDNWILRKQGRDGDYIVYPELGKIVWLSNFPLDGHQNIKVIYTIGSPSVPRFVSALIEINAALRALQGRGVGADGVKEMVEKLKERRMEYEKWVPQWTGMYAVGSRQFLR